jgi:hypothetical protein
LSAIPLAALFLLGACSSNSDTTGGLNPPPASQQFLILGSDMSGYSQNVVVSLNDAVAAGVTVTVNGDTLTTTSGSGFYSGHLTTAVAEGGAVQVRVTNGTLTAVGNGLVPAAPVITDVQHGALGAPVTINWTAATSSDSVNVYLDYRLSDSSTASINKTVAGSARTVTLATSGIPANSVVTAAGVDAVMNGTFTGDVAAASNMRLRAVGGSFPVTIP